MEDNSEAWLTKTVDILMNGLNKMGNAILATARVTVPRKDGNLANSGRVKRREKEVIIRYGNQEVNYAKVQEDGHRGDVYFKHYTTPGTGPHYLENAGKNKVKDGIKKYL